MTTVLLLIHLFVTIALIGVVLIQRSEGGGLGVGTSQGMGSFMSGRGTANLLTRTTAILGTIFFALSLVLALINRGTTVHRSILDVPPPPASTAPANAIPGPPNAAAPKPAVPGAVTPGGAPGAAPSAQPGPERVPAPKAPAGPSVPTN